MKHTTKYLQAYRRRKANSVILRPELIERIDIEAKNRGISRSSLISTAVDKELVGDSTSVQTDEPLATVSMERTPEEQAAIDRRVAQFESWCAELEAIGDEEPLPDDAFPRIKFRQFEL
jgi:hypothetical protein